MRTSENQNRKYIEICVSEIRDAQASITDTNYLNGVSDEWKIQLIDKYNKRIEDITNKLIRLYETTYRRD